MLKGMLIGIVAGVMLAAGAWKVFASHKDVSPVSAGNAPVAAADHAPDPELEKARSENARLRGELASVRKSPGPDPVASPKTPAGKAKNSWKDIGAKVYKLRDKIKEKDHTGPEMSELMSEFLALLGEASERYGVTLDEAILSPDGMLGMLLGVLESSDCPPDGSQHAKLEVAMAATEKGWKDYLAGREDRTAMERSRDLLALAGGGMQAMNATMTAEQRAMLESLHMFNDVPAMGLHSSVTGDRASVATQLTDRWKDDLSLDETQAASIRPIVDEYMRGFDALETEDASRKAAGDPMDDWSKALQRQDLMVGVQKRMKETLRLTDAQAAAMKEWNETAGYTITK